MADGDGSNGGEAIASGHPQSRSRGTATDSEHAGDKTNQGHSQVRSISQLLTPSSAEPASSVGTPVYSSDLDGSDGNIPVRGSERQPRRDLFDYKKIVSGMKKKISDTLSLEPSERMILDRLVSVAHDFDVSMGARAEVHLMITIPDPNPQSTREVVAPVVSKLFLTALDRASMASSSSSQALSDAFTVARRGIMLSSRASLLVTPPRPKVSVPEWLDPTSVRTDARCGDDEMNHLRVNDDVLKAIERLRVNEVMSVYGDFFGQLWLLAKDKFGWKGPILYERLTPNWLRGDVVFLHGPNGSLSIPCTHRVLPRKGFLKDRGQKIVGSSILAYWLQQEVGTAPLLRWFLLQKNATILVNITDENADETMGLET